MAKKKKAEEESAGSPWLSTFADLMNLLLCFFVLLFASSSPDAAKYEQIVASFSNNFSIFTTGGQGIGDGTLISAGASQLNNIDEYFTDMGKPQESESVKNPDPLAEYEKKMQEAARDLYEEIKELTTRYSMESYVKLDIDSNNRFVKISLSGAVLFDSGKADIKTEAKPILDNVGEVLLRYKEHQIVVEGHTDNQQIVNSSVYRDNRWLSTARACTVSEYLIDKKQLDPRKVESSGRGEYSPIASNDTAEGRAKNRRVEIKIYNDVLDKK